MISKVNENSPGVDTALIASLFENVDEFEFYLIKIVV